MDKRTTALATFMNDGIEAAAKALIDVCKDEAAPPAARVQAAAHISRIAGLLSADSDAAKADPTRIDDSATIDELHIMLARLKAQAATTSSAPPAQRKAQYDVKSPK